MSVSRSSRLLVTFGEKKKKDSGRSSGTSYRPCCCSWFQGQHWYPLPVILDSPCLSQHVCCSKLSVWGWSGVTQNYLSSSLSGLSFCGIMKLVTRCAVQPLTWVIVNQQCICGPAQCIELTHQGMGNAFCGHMCESKEKGRSEPLFKKC